MLQKLLFAFPFLEAGGRRFLYHFPNLKEKVKQLRRVQPEPTPAAFNPSGWDAYQKAFEDAINETSTKHCPWYVVPADHKWYMRYVVSEIILATLRDMDPRYPEVTEDRRASFAKYREELLKELPDYTPKPAKKKKK